MKESRRDFIRKSSAIAALTVAGTGLIHGEITGNVTDIPDKKIRTSLVKWPVIEGPDTPILCLNSSRNEDVKEKRNVFNVG